MRFRTRWVLGLCGLAMSGPAATSALAQGASPYPGGPSAAAPFAGGSPVINLQQTSEPAPAGAMPPGPAGMPPTWGGTMGGASYMPGSPATSASAPGVATTADAPAPEHHHHGLLGRRHCVECQRARAKAVDGIDVPPPPGYPGAPAMHAAAGTVISGPVVISERIVGQAEMNAPGHAVVGGPEEAGFAVVNAEAPAPGSEPTPIGVARGGQPAPMDPRMAAAMSRPGVGPGSYDPNVAQTSVPAPPTPMSGPGHNHPHIIYHLLDLPKLGKYREQREWQERERHAMEAYGDAAKTPVHDLPAEMVYGQQK